MTIQNKNNLRLISLFLLINLLANLSLVANNVSLNEAPKHMAPQVQPQDLKNLVVLDRVEATVYLSDKPDLGSEDKDEQDQLQVITKQDIARAGFDGKEHLLENEIYATQLELKAQSMKMSLSEEDRDRRLEEMGLSREHQVLMAEKWHYFDLQEFKQAVQKMFVSNMSQAFEIESRLVIPQVEIQAYYEQNPVWLEPCYEIKLGFVPFNNAKEQAKLQRKLEGLVATGKGFKVDWDGEVVIKQSELSSDNQFLVDLAVDQIYFKPAKNGFDVFKMISILPKRLQPILERRNEIINILRTSRHEQALKDIKQDLDNKSVIFYPQI